ncbi:hypothetical protein ABH926_008369 [Catenulispora sp. GP43]|uniref:DUF397 domain-containing protein n=1 Tax=Catenulispora sp. GP43 TaxID=3156263 RepID=UPI003517C17A
MSTSATPNSTPENGAAPHETLLTGAAWRKSSYSNNANNCVEVALLPNGGVGVRHSRRPDAEVIIYSRSEWAAFVAGVKDEEFDLNS